MLSTIEIESRPKNIEFSMQDIELDKLEAPIQLDLGEVRHEQDPRYKEYDNAKQQKDFVYAISVGASRQKHTRQTVAAVASMTLKIVDKTQKLGVISRFSMNIQ